MIGRAGLVWWQIPDFNIGALTGILIGDIIQPYAGYRQHFLIAEGVGLYGNVIGGVEIYTGSIASLMFEFDYTFLYDGSSAGGTTLNSDLFTIPVINAGITLSF